jgi:hypothetical protein
MRKVFSISFFFFFFLLIKIAAQDTLPHIVVKNFGEKNIVSWKNNYGARISTINIQRSFDSLKNFSTIGSVLNPLNRENGFVDNKPPGTKIFYRVFIAFEGGAYRFSTSHAPTKDSSNKNATEAINEELIKVVTPSGYVASKHIYTGRDNNVIINIPNAATSKYSVKFFDEKNNLVFETHIIPEPYLIIEKVNFLHAGWFRFELYENGLLQEKHKLYIPKEGKYGIPVGDQSWKE